VVSDSTLTFYHSPRTRSAGTFMLLEELGVPYNLKVLDMQAGEQRQPEYLAINPMGKVPAISHNGALITEQIAIFIYLADAFPEAGLAPALGDPLRGPYLRWMAFYAGCFEPAVADRALKREPGPQGMLGYGDFDSMLATLVAQLAAGPYVLGARFSALDVLWGSALRWTTHFKIVPELPEIKRHLEAFNARPAVRKVVAEDAALLAAQGNS
jgi:glutathione S-transferase